MLFVEENVIYITKGDDAGLDVTITDENGEAYAMQDGDTLTLTVRQLPEATSPKIFAVTSASSRIVLSAQDTAGAEVGQYSADIQLNSSGRVRTVWPMLDGRERRTVRNFKNFVIMPEVTI